MVALASSLGASSCATQTLGRLASNEDLPSDLPADVSTRFAAVALTPSKAADHLPKARVAGLRSGETGFASAEASAGQGDVPDVVSKSRRHPKAKSADRRIVTLAGPSEPLPPRRRPPKDPIWAGEKFVYSLKYFGVEAGEFTLEALPFKAVNSRKSYHVRGTAVTSRVFNMVYRVNDVIESYFDYEGLYSHRFHLSLDETRQSRDALELNDGVHGRTFYANRWQKFEQPLIDTKGYFDVPNFAQDSLSALYFIRTLPLLPDSVESFPVISDGKSWQAEVSVIRRESVESPIGKVQAVVVRPEAKFTGVMQRQGDSFMWLTDDDRRIILKFEAKVKIGTLVAELKRVELGTPPTTSDPAQLVNIATAATGP